MTRAKAGRAVWQRNSGNGSVQVGQAGGNVTVINHYYGAQTYSAPVVRRDAVQRRAVRDALSLLQGVRDRIAILDWMERELGSRLVKDLPTYKINRLQRYVQGALRNEAARKLGGVRNASSHVGGGLPAGSARLGAGVQVQGRWRAHGDAADAVRRRGRPG